MTTFETNALEINDLNKNYPGFSLNHLNLTLPSGCILGLIGENGAGKTTTIKLILDIIKKDSGSIRILGRDCTSATTILKEEIGVVLDEVGFQECLTPLQIGRIMKDIFHKWDPSLYDQYLQKFNLPNKKEFGKFSKGMKIFVIMLPFFIKVTLFFSKKKTGFWKNTVSFNVQRNSFRNSINLRSSESNTLLTM